MTASSVLEGPEIDPLDLLRRVSMAMIAQGHDRIGGRMLEALRPQMADPCDADASYALAELSRGDVSRARERLEREVLTQHPTHPMALLVRAACDRAQDLEHWKRGPQAVLASAADPKWRQAARDMMNA